MKRPILSDSHAMLAKGKQARFRGLTLVELLVALALSLLVVAAAVAMFIATRQTYGTVDAAAQLRENGRFASDIISRVAVQAGYTDLIAGALSNAQAAQMLGEDPEPDVIGFNNAVPDTTDPITETQHNSRPASCGSISDSSCMNGSDVLVLRYHGSSDSVTGDPDNSMINCAGYGEIGVIKSTDDRAVSIFSVRRAPDGEPTLYCSYRSWKTSEWDTQPLISGVESLQLLFGIDASDPTKRDTVPDRYVRADELSVGTPAAIRENWRRVRAIRVGMVLRGAQGTSGEPVTAKTTFSPLGKDMYADATKDPGVALTPGPDTRLRQVVTFTVHLRNTQTTKCGVTTSCE